MGVKVGAGVRVTVGDASGRSVAVADAVGTGVLVLIAGTTSARPGSGVLSTAATCVISTVGSGFTGSTSARK